MNSENWHDVLTLMTMVIVADRKVYKEEVDTFVASVNALNGIISPDFFIPESMAFEWFKANHKKVQNMLIGKDAQTNCRETIMKSINVPHKDKIIEVMKDIANADSEYHNQEHHVIKQASYLWKVSA